MSIVNLEKRITNDNEEYIKNCRSSDSLIYVKDEYELDNSGPDCLAISIGKCWYHDGRYIKIDSQKGIRVKAHASIVFEAQEEIALPLNVYGIIFGAGSNIYRGGFISNGKIDPGFRGKLLIGYHNGGDKAVYLHTGNKLAYIIFWEAECDREYNFSTLNKQPAMTVMNVWERIVRWIGQNDKVLTLFFAVIGCIISIVALFLKT